MRYAIFGDANNRFNQIKSVFRSTQSEDIDKYVCIGDIIRKRIYSQKIGNLVDLTIKILKEYGVLSISGSHEKFILDSNNKHVSDKSLEYFANLPDKLIIDDVLFIHESPSRKFLILQNPNEFEIMEKEYFNQKICFFGHSHKRLHFQKNNSKYNANYFPKLNLTYDVSSGLHLINPGTVRRQIFPFGFFEDPSYVVYDTEEKTVTFRKIE